MGLDSWTIFRTSVYILGGCYGLYRSHHHHRLFGLGVAILCWSFAYRLYGTLQLGLGDLRWTSNVGATFFLATIFYDMAVDYMRSR
ncbi:MAG: hypothetical protein AAF702_33055 [Chloroflexota bacterium]